MKMNRRVDFTWKCLPSCPWNTSTQIHPHTAGPPTWWSWSCWWYKNSQLMWHSNCKLLEPEVCVASSQDVSDDFAIRRCLVNIPIKTPEHQQILHVLHFYFLHNLLHIFSLALHHTWNFSFLKNSCKQAKFLRTQILHPKILNNTSKNSP